MTTESVKIITSSHHHDRDTDLHVARHADGGGGGRELRVESRLAAVVRGRAGVPEQAGLGPEREKLSEERRMKVSVKQLSAVHMEDTSQQCVVTVSAHLKRLL